MPSLLRTARDVCFDDVAQVPVPRLSDGHAALLGDAVSLVAGTGATLAMAGAVVLAGAPPAEVNRLGRIGSVSVWPLGRSTHQAHQALSVGQISN